MDGEDLIASVYHKIEREKALIHAAANMRHSTDNPLVQQQVDSNIRDGRKNIAYLEEKMRELQLRRIEQENDGTPAGGRNQGPGPRPPPKDGYPPNERGESPGYATGRAATVPVDAQPKARPNYSKLGTTCPTPTRNPFFFFFFFPDG